MVYYKLTHFFITKQPDYFHRFPIGIYDSRAKALTALDCVKSKPGFCLRPNAFHILPVIRFRQPKLVNRTYWIDGFETYTYIRK